MSDVELLKNDLEKPVVLVGTGGAGKTSLGQALASLLGKQFIDSDNIIIEKEGFSIPEIFAQKGEPHFRQAERDALSELMQNPQAGVIGTGGGAFMDDQTRALIKQNGLSVFIKADLPVLQERIGDGVGRPLYEGKDIEKVLSDLIEVRYPVYEEADLVVPTYSEGEEETLNRLISALYKHISLD